MPSCQLLPTMAAWGRDLRYAARLLRRSPLFALVAIATLALGIGLNSAVFSLVDAALFKPLPVRAPERLVRIFSAVPDEPMTNAPMAVADLADLRADCASLDQLAAFFYTGLALERGDDSRLVMAELTSGNYFATLGVVPALGRVFGEEEARGSRF